MNKDIKHQAQLELCRREFKDFVLYFFKQEKRKEFIWNWHFDLIATGLIDLMLSDTELLVINIHPRAGKTEIITKLFPVWWLGRNPNTEVISTGYSATLTQGFSAEARDYIKSDTFAEIFPRVKIKEDQNTKEHWKTTGGGSYYATGTGGTITGKGADLFIIDDPLNPNDAEASSQTNIVKVNTWLSNVAMSRLNSKRVDGVIVKGKMLIIMQRLHDNDLCGYLFREHTNKFDNGSWKQLVIPAVAIVDDSFRSVGDAMFPQLYPTEWLQNQKEVMTNEQGNSFFSAQYQQNPIDAEHAEFKREQFRYHEESEVTGQCKTIIGVDPAISEKTTADYSALSVVSRRVTDDLFFIRDIIHGRMNPDILVETIFALQSTYGETPVAIETIGFQKAFVSIIRKEQQARGVYFRIIELGNRGEKEARIRTGLQPLYENFKISHPKKLAYTEYEDELLRFPKSRHDDLIDAVENAVSSFSRGIVDVQPVNYGIISMTKNEFQP